MPELSDAAFLIIIVMLGVLIFGYFGEMKRRREKKRRDEAKEIDFWLRGKDDDD